MDLTQELSQLLNGLKDGSQKFADTLALIDRHYDYTPAEFYNGEQHNPAGTNEGSCKVLYFGKLNDLTQVDTLKLFGEHYEAVTKNPAGSDHSNIREFMENNWHGVRFTTCPLKLKA